MPELLRRRVEIVRLVSFIAAYALALQASEHLYGSLSVPSPFYIPDSVLLCALLLTERQHWWMFVLSIAPIRLIHGAVPGTPEWFVLVSTANSAFKALASAWLLERVVGRPVRLRSFHEFLCFLAIAAAIVPFLSALAAAPARHALGDPLWNAGYRWFLGNALAQVIVTPTLLYWCTSQPLTVTTRRAELALLSSGLVAVSYYALVSHHAGDSPPALYAPIPFLLWAAGRFGVLGAANSLSLVAILSVLGAVNGTGVFASGSVLSIQLFLLVLGVSVLSLATLNAETERKTLELEDAELRYRTVAEFTADWEYWITPDGAFAYSSPSCLQLTGYEAAEFSARPDLLRDLLVDGDRGARDAHHQGASQGAGPLNFESRIRTKNGDTKWVDLVLSPVASLDGHHLGIRGSARDVTAKKQSEEMLRAALDDNRRLRDQLEADNAYLREEARRDWGVDGMLVKSAAMADVAAKVGQVAPTPTTVLLLGETGVGKSLIARAIHNQSLRRMRPLVTLNCAAIPATLMESELFGHEKGAFTGADARRVGRFEVADGGTLFLDEIGELPLELQSRLLRAVQDGEFERVGSSVSLRTDARLIAASNRPLDAEVRAGRFRSDLWYRLNVFPITVPPLRERREAIPFLTAHFIEKHCRKMGRPKLEVSRATMAQLQAHSWPGNVRELENVVERAVILSRGKWAEMSVDGLQPTDSDSPKQVATGGVDGQLVGLEDLQRQHIYATLEQVYWRVEGSGGAAELLGMNPNTLRSRMRKLGIRRPVDRPRPRPALY